VKFEQGMNFFFGCSYFYCTSFCFVAIIHFIHPGNKNNNIAQLHIPVDRKEVFQTVFGKVLDITTNMVLRVKSKNSGANQLKERKFKSPPHE
jgi:hypothetical protein